MPSHFSARTDAALPEGERDPLNRALRDLSHQVGSAMPRNTTPMPISVFKAQYGAVLKQADHDGVALISQGRKRYVIVSEEQDRKSTRLNSSHSQISYAVFCLK